MKVLTVNFDQKARLSNKKAKIKRFPQNIEKEIKKGKFNEKCEDMVKINRKRFCTFLYFFSTVLFHLLYLFLLEYDLV